VDTPTDLPGEWLSASDAADLLGLTARAVQDRCRAGYLIGRQTPTGRWEVQRASVEASLPSPTAGTQTGGPGELNALLELAMVRGELDQLRAQVTTLVARVAELERERVALIAGGQALSRTVGELSASLFGAAGMSHHE
jgi:catalase (peroxidase I)